MTINIYMLLILLVLFNTLRVNCFHNLRLTTISIKSTQSLRNSPITSSSLFNGESEMLDSFRRKDRKSRNALDVIGKSAKYVVTGIATYFVICTDSWLPMYYILGGVVNAITGKTLKSIIRQPRPADSPKKGFGLPSSHAQSLFYFCTVLSTIFFSRCSSVLLATFFSASMFIYAYFACLWRVKTKLHTAFQTFAGLAFGSSFAMAMFLSESRAYPIVGRYLEGGNSAAFAVRLFISIIGIAVIFSKELKPFLKKLK